MASLTQSAHFNVKIALLFIVACTAQAQLSPFFYARSCPALPSIVFTSIDQAIRREPRMGASLLRLFFHDCFVNGCDASILLDNTPTFTGEQGALPNRDSIRGLEVIDAIKERVEAICPGVVSCADILALAAKDSVFRLGGPSWSVPLGRRDSTTASETDANNDLPPFFASLSELTSFFDKKGLNVRDMTALSGAHTIGQAQCSTFSDRVNGADANIDPAFAAFRRANCPSGGNSNLAPLDGQTQNRFDGAYYQNLVARRGLLHSDQELFNNGTVDGLVRNYAFNTAFFFRDFSVAMVKMGNISPRTGSNGQIRNNCGRVN